MKKGLLGLASGLLAVTTALPAMAWNPPSWLAPIVIEEVTSQFYTTSPGSIQPLPAAPFPTRNAGSMFVQTAELRVQGTGEAIGTSHALCTIVTDGRSRFEPGPNPPFFGTITPIVPPDPVALAQCSQTLRLPQGDLLLGGLLDQYAFEAFQPAKYAIVGGTGLFKLARGSVTITQVIFPHTARIEIRLFVI